MNTQASFINRLFKISILSILFSLIFPVYSIPSLRDPCEGSFIKGTRYEAQLQASRENYDAFHSDHLDFRRDQELVFKWDVQSEGVPTLFQMLVPEGVFPINHREDYSSRPYLVRLQEWGASISARVHYTHKGIPISTNVLFGVNNIKDRIRNWNRKWLVSPRANAAILYLHGGGTRTTGSTAFASSLTHFARYGIEGVAIDLPMHSEGSRKIFGSIQEEILSIGSFAKKYIPENVPLFVYGHSFGAVFTDEIMRMTGKHKGGTNFFHPALKGVIIASPPVMEASPEKSLLEKIQSFIKSQDLARDLANKDIPSKGEQNIWADVVGKISPLGEFFLGLVMSQMNQSIPEAERSNLIRALMMVGKHDFLVYQGAEELFHNYFDSLPNVDVQYFDRRPDRSTEASMKVGHLLNGYHYSQDVKAPLDAESVVRFVANELGIAPEGLLKKMETDFPTNMEGESLILLLQNYFNDLSTRYWLNHFTDSKITNDANYIEKLMEIQNHDYSEALKLYEQYRPENQLISLLKGIVLASSRKEIQSFQQQLKKMRSDNDLPFSSSLLVDLENANNESEAERLSKEILHEHFLELSEYKSIADIVDNVRNNKNLSHFFDTFPFNQDVFVPENSIFFIPPLFRTHILDLLSMYNNKEDPRWIKDKVVQEIRSILNEYDPSKVLFRILDDFSPLSKDSRKQYLEDLKLYKDQLSSFVNQEELNKDLEVLIKERSIPKMIAQALLIIRKYAVPPVTPSSYFISKLKRKVNNPEVPLSEVALALKPFQLPQNIQDQIMNILKGSRKESYSTVRDLVIEHTPITLVYNLVQVLKRMTSGYALEEFIKDFSNYPLFNERTRHTYFSYLENHEILQGVLSGSISSNEVWNRKYYPLKEFVSGKNPVHQVFKSKRDIAQILEQTFIPENVKEQIRDHYDNYKRIDNFIKGKHVPDLHHFSRNLHNGEELTQEQTKEYQGRINRIKKNVSSVTQLERKKSSLITEKKKLEAEVGGLINHINHDIHLIQSAFRGSLSNPPASMAQQYDSFRENYYAPLEATTYKLTDLMYESVLPLLEGQNNFTFEQTQEVFHQIFSNEDIQILVQKREELFDVWKKKRRELAMELINVLIKGEMGTELQQAAVNLYGHLPQFNFSTNEGTRYFILQARSLQLAEIEAELLDVQGRIVTLSVEYDRLYPNSVLSVVEPIHPMEILNFDSQNTSVPEYIRDNDRALSHIWQAFKNLRASLPPALPDLE